jgi:hypothetical protein
MVLKDGKLRLSNGKGNAPLVLDWRWDLPNTNDNSRRSNSAPLRRVVNSLPVTWTLITLKEVKARQKARMTAILESRMR